jgi:hypothetical protein
MTPLTWAAGDRCVVEGRICTVSRVRDGFASVRRGDGVSMFRPVGELEMVPFAAQAIVAGIERVFGLAGTEEALAKADTLPAPAEEA